jgi:transposase
MNHVAVDLGSRKSQYCVRSADGKVVGEANIETSALKGFFEGLGKSRVVLETCSEAFTVADYASAAGHEVIIVPATLAPSLGVGHRGVKTDKRDAQNLSNASCRIENMPSVHRPSEIARDRRSMLAHRATLVAARTMFVNSVKGWARAHLLRVPSGKTSTFPERMRDAALAEPEGLPSYIERNLKVLEQLNEQIDAADKELEELSEKDPLCKRLMTMPGVGPVTAMSFRSSIDDVTRFKSAHAVESYLGLTPGENSTGTTRTGNRLGLTKAGPTKVRTALIQAAWCAYRTRPTDPMVQWARKLAEKKKVQVAVTALARKMSGILYAMWRDGADYNPTYEQQQQP